MVAPVAGRKVEGLWFIEFSVGVAYVRVMNPFTQGSYGWIERRNVREDVLEDLGRKARDKRRCGNTFLPEE